MKIDRYDVARLFGYGYKIQFFEEGFNLQLWERPKDNGLKAKCTENPMYLHGEEYISYTVSIPRPACAVCVGFGIVIRTSAHRYKAALTNSKGAVIDTFQALADVARYCQCFFGK